MTLDEITDARRKAIAASIRPISADEVRTLTDKFFTYLDDPWREKLTEFLDQNPYASFHHAATEDHFEIIYSQAENKGMWFLPGSGMGILQARGIKAMQEIIGGGA